MQYVSAEYIDHATGEDEPKSATESVQFGFLKSDFERGRNGLGTHLGIIHRKSNDSASLCPTLSKPEKNSLHPIHNLLSPSIPQDLPNHPSLLHRNEPEKGQGRKKNSQ